MARTLLEDPDDTGLYCGDPNNPDPPSFEKYNIRALAAFSKKKLEETGEFITEEEAEQFKIK